MKRIFVVAIVTANLAFTASAALAEGNGYHEPFYLVGSKTAPSYPVSLNTVRTGRGGATAIGAVTGPAVLVNCPYCSLRIDNMGH